MIKVSVIVPIHNSSKYLDRLFFSLQNQTLKDIEFIFVENGSTDDSYEKLQEMAKKEPRARVFNIGKSTIGGAMNFGITKAKGEFITLNDHDDFYVRDGLLKLYENVTTGNALAVISNIINISCKTINNNLHKKFNLQTRNVEANFHKSNIPIVGWACLVNRDFVLKHNIKYMEANLHHDSMFFTDLWQEIYAKEHGNKLINFMPEFVSYIRIVEPSTSLTYNSSMTLNRMYKKLKHCVYFFKIFAKITKKNKKLYKNIPKSENILFLKPSAITRLHTTLEISFSKWQWVVFTYYLAKFYKTNKDYFVSKKILPNELNVILGSVDDIAKSRVIAFSIKKIIKLANFMQDIANSRNIERIYSQKIAHDIENCFCQNANFDAKKEIIDVFYEGDNSALINEKTGTMFW